MIFFLNIIGVFLLLCIHTKVVGEKLNLKKVVMSIILFHLLSFLFIVLFKLLLYLSLITPHHRYCMKYSPYSIYPSDLHQHQDNQ